MNALFLIDGNSFAYRAYYAIGHLSSAKGQATNAVYGFTKMLQKIFANYSPEYLAIAFDKGKGTFRHKKYEEYKAHRKPMPDDLVSQIPWIKKIVRAYNIPLLESDEYEADDIIAALAAMGKKKGLKVKIITGDKDMLQLVSDDIEVISPAKEDVVYDEKKVIERFGVAPKMIPELLALTGDSSDNIHGVPGIGEKTAAKLLQEYGGLSGLLDSVDSISSQKQKQSIKENIQNIKSNMELLVLMADIGLDVSADDCRKKDPDIDALKDIYRELEFKGLLEELLKTQGANNNGYSEVEIIEDRKKWEDILNEIKKNAEIGITYGPAGFGIAFKTGGGIRPAGVYTGALDGIVSLLADPKIAVYGDDLKSLYKIALENNAQINGRVFDVSIASYLLELHADKTEDNLSLTDLAMQAARVLNDFFGLEKKLISEGLIDLYNSIELPLAEVLSSMEVKGIKIDTDVLEKLKIELERDIKKLTEKIFKTAGEEFNISSPKQLENILFEKLKLPSGRRTKTGFSTDVDVLTELMKYHQLPGLILDYRQLVKLLNTYIVPLPQMADKKDGRIHTTFDQTGTVTGRLSSYNPNLQNIPIKSELGKKIRRAFIPAKNDIVFLGADYSQIELRILAHLSGDKRLIQAFRGGKDIHTATAMDIFGLEEIFIDQSMRRQAKVVNFGIIYGMGAVSLSKTLDIEVKEAQGYIDRYFQRYPEASAYIKRTLDSASSDGYVVTMFGRKRHVPELKSGKQQIQSFGRRIAVNTPIQGSAADIIKVAMININKRLRERHSLGASMLLQVHDELIFEVPSANADVLEALVKKEMEQAVSLKVPLKVEINIGQSWADL